MKHSIISKKSPLASSVAKLALVVVLSGAAVHQASAVGSLIFDLRASTVNSIPVGDFKNVTGLDVGDTVVLNLWVAVIGTNGVANDESFAFGHFGILTTNGNNAVQGNLGSAFGVGNVPTSGVTFNTNWNAGGQNGLFGTDRNGDGGMDIGLLATSTTAASFAKPRSTTTSGSGGVAGALAFGGTPLTINGLVNGVGQEFLLGTISYRVTSVVSAAQQTLLNFSLPSSLGIGGSTPKANWQVDGTSGAQTLQGIANNPVVLTGVPEPSAFGMVLMGALGLVGFRRLGFRRSS